MKLTTQTERGEMALAKMNGQRLSTPARGGFDLKIVRAITNKREISMRSFFKKIKWLFKGGPSKTQETQYTPTVRWFEGAGRNAESIRDHTVQAARHHAAIDLAEL